MADKKAVEVPAVVKPESTAVVDWQAQLTSLATATADAEKPSGNWMSFQGGRLKINDVLMRDDKVKGVVLYSIFENQLYAKKNEKGELVGDKYDADNPKSPVCFAFAETDDDLKPHPDSLWPQAPTCGECKHNAWGSDFEGGRGKSCKNVRRLAWLSEVDLAPDKIDKAQIVMSKLPVTSVKNWSTYANQLANVLKLPPLAVITELSVVPNTKTILQVEFQLVDKITDGAVIQKLLARRKDIHPLIFAPYDKPIEPKERPPAEARKF
jgi:hypothetical protein